MINLHRLLLGHASELKAVEQTFREACAINADALLLIAPPQYDESDMLLAATTLRYWLRAYLVRNRGAKDTMELMQMLLDMPVEVASEFGFLNLDEHFVSMSDDSKEVSMRTALKRTIADHASMLDEGDDLLSEWFLDTCLNLAQFESLIRVNNPLANPSQAIVNDVRNMAALAIERDQKDGIFVAADNRYYINPWFPAVVREMRTIDADFGLGRTIVTVGTATRLFTPLMLSAGAAYLALEHISRAELGRQPRFDRIGFYAARFGLFIEIDPYKSERLQDVTVSVGSVLLAHRPPNGESAYDGCIEIEEEEPSN